MHNTPEQNQAFHKAFDATNARWKAAVEQDKKETKPCQDTKSNLNRPV